MIAFIRGTRTPIFTMATPSSSKTASKAAVYLLSRSRIRYFTVASTSWRSITHVAVPDPEDQKTALNGRSRPFNYIVVRIGM
jgi:hypothetical protein